MIMMQRIRRKILILRPCFAPSSEDEISPSEELVVEDDIYSDDYEQVKPGRKIVIMRTSNSERKTRCPEGKKVLQEEHGSVTSVPFKENMTDRPSDQPTDEPECSYGSYNTSKMVIYRILRLGKLPRWLPKI